MSNYIKHAKQELKAIGYDLNDKKEGPNKWMIENLLELLNVFDKQGHSGFSANYCANAFKKLALFEPLGPLTGAKNEWQKISNDTWQNIRCSHVFKNDKEQAYDIDGKVFREPDGSCFTNKESIVYITFPYNPESKIIDVKGD